ncbi:MAG: 2-amino-4-hydroxy-6-hydroxymethyldihydropteridine diphosphokinase [Dehalococcoidia bacterium]|nr:2-amino-4-hydroxy-6-hydroxymethyldihydropteridine diphosphokinase [Dehalococcoidia bacterium]
MVLVYLSIGSNLGFRYSNIRSAILEINKFASLFAISSVYSTKPAGFLAQPYFLNVVCSIKTTMEPLQLLGRIQALESYMGRVPMFKNGPRIIDIDILSYGEVLVDFPQLQIPHPRMHERNFVLTPLEEIEPDFLHPLLRIPVSDLLERLPDADHIVRIGETIHADLKGLD